MPSIIPGYEYDIFISYRQKDNKGERWVSKFVEALKTELESTFKEDISVYFDKNPHDGLLETQDVDASLQNKLKCLIFIPVISRTYCDPKSFAWQYELKNFIELASEDQFGLRVKLPNGNVASRVLPVRIYDLDSNDIGLYETLTGGVLRGVDFIYSEPGVNRPLLPEDDEKLNLNKTRYRNQVNKVGNAVKDIMLGLNPELIIREGDQALITDSKEVKTVGQVGNVPLRPFRVTINRVLSAALIAGLLLAFTFWILPRLHHQDSKNIVKDPDGRISIAVTIFENITNDTTLNWLTRGIPELLRNNLAGCEELSVHNSQTMYELFQSMGQIQKGSVAPSFQRDAAIKLKTGTYITGSFQKFGNNLLTYIKLIDTRSDELLWTGNIEGDLDSYKHLADSISDKLKDFLEIKAIKQKAGGEYNDVNTNSPEALKSYIEGMQLMINGNFKSAALSFEASFRIDTTFAMAPIYASFSHSYENDFAAAIYWTKVALKVKSRLPYYYQLWCESAKACNITKDADSALYYNDLLASSDIKSRLFWFDIGYNYLVLSQYSKSVNAFEKVQTISTEWGGDWKYRLFYRFFGNACHYAGYHQREAEINETGLKLFPGDFMLIYQQALCSLARGDTAEASLLSKELVDQVRKTGASESDIENGYGKLYEDAGLFEDAEKHYRAALKSDPKNLAKISTLAMFIVRHGTNILEAEKLSAEVLKLKPGDQTGLWVKGLVQFRQGKYEDAVKNMEQALSESPVWNIKLFYDIKAAKNAGKIQNQL